MGGKYWCRGRVPFRAVCVFLSSAPVWDRYRTDNRFIEDDLSNLAEKLCNQFEKNSFLGSEVKVKQANVMVGVSLKEMHANTQKMVYEHA